MPARAAKYQRSAARQSLRCSCNRGGHRRGGHRRVIVNLPPLATMTGRPSATPPPACAGAVQLLGPWGKGCQPAGHHFRFPLVAVLRREAWWRVEGPGKPAGAPLEVVWAGQAGRGSPGGGVGWASRPGLPWRWCGLSKPAGAPLEVMWAGQAGRGSPGDAVGWGGDVGWGGQSGGHLPLEAGSLSARPCRLVVGRQVEPVVA